MQNVTVEQLENMEIFKNISKTSLKELAFLGEVRKYKIGSHLFRDKEDVNTLYVVVSGSVKDRFLVLITRQKALNRANFKNIRLVKD
jgi:signal-transduction protein with cAMP-binding, CBS, and nucleotidyltransferase domain